MAGNTTTLLPPKGSAENKRDFTFDHSLWSFDEYNEEADGYLS